MPMGGGRGIHNGGFRLHPWSGHFSTHGTRSKTDTRVAAYPFNLPRICQGIDIQDALLFSKPDRRLDGRPIPFDTSLSRFRYFCPAKGARLGLDIVMPS